MSSKSVLDLSNEGRGHLYEQNEPLGAVTRVNTRSSLVLTALLAVSSMRALLKASVM